MANFYLNNKPISQGVAVHHLANALPNQSFKQVRELVYLASQGYKFPMQKLGEYGISVGGV